VLVPGFVDGFVIPMKKKDVPAYRRLAQKAAKVWMEHGAVEFRECVGEDLIHKGAGMVSFPKLAKAKAGETVFFSYIVYRSRRHRDQVNAKVMKDPRLAKMMEKGGSPFDPKRMAYGGFKILVEG
jgi:uncharacterized protein YbaA (DUF1428 family)